MAALGVNRATMLRHPEAGARRVRYPVKASAHIYKGSMVMILAGYLTPAADTAGGLFKGIAEEEVNNTGADGAAFCNVLSSIGARLVGSGIVAADVGKKAYVTDDQTVQDAANTNAVVAGCVEELESANVVWVLCLEQY